MVFPDPAGVLGKRRPWRPFRRRQAGVLKDDGKGTTLIVVHDAADEYKEMFEQALPKALQRVKELATQRQPAAPR